MRVLASCPLPVAMTGNPNALVRLQYDTTATPATCTYGSTLGGAGQECSSAAAGGYSIAEMYECMPDGTTAQAVWNAAGAGICCANRGTFYCL